jgi:translation elongation factor EF-4
MKNRVHIEETEYHVDKENKVVLCTLHVHTQLFKHPAWISISRDFFVKRFPFIEYNGEFIVKAKARCNKEDVFDEVIGKRIAESRAKVKAYNIASRMWECITKAMNELALQCNTTMVACAKAEIIEREHVKELIKINEDNNYQ